MSSGLRRLASRLDAAPWAVVDSILRPAWRTIEGLPGVGDRPHIALDHLISKVKTELHGFKFYADGWGGSLPSLLPSTAASLVACARSPARAGAPAPLRRLVLQEVSGGPSGVRIAEGSFDTPGDVQQLPAPSHRAHFQIVTPAPTRGMGGGRSLPCAILLPGTGEQGYRRRRQCVAYPLAAAGVASIILEGPLYGARRPPVQAGTKLRTYCELLTLGLTTISEAAALVGWLRGTPPVYMGEVQAPSPASWLRGAPPLGEACGAIVLAGTSMGGLHAAMSASALPLSLSEGVGVASWLGPPSAAPVFALGALSRGVAWEALAAGAQRGSPFGEALEAGLVAMEAALSTEAAGGGWGSEGELAFWRRHTLDVLAAGAAHHLPESPRAAAAGAGGSPRGLPHAALLHARQQLARASAVTDITRFPPPARPDAAVFTVADADQYIPSTPTTRATWEHVQRVSWAGCDVRAMRGGHVSAAVFAVDRLVGTIREVVGRLHQV